MSTHSHPGNGPFARLAQIALIATGAVVGAFTDVARADLVITDDGGATIVRNGDMWEIHAADGTIIEYSRFDIGRDQLVSFFQGGAGNRVLNRVDGPISMIEGILRADGTIYLVNPAGVVFTGTSVVDVAGMYAAAGSISNADFLDPDKDIFTNLTGEVIVEAGARIGGGPLHTTEALHLLGKRVENHGILMADGGIITMIAGDQILLQEFGDRLVVFVDGERLTDVDQPASTATSSRMTGNARVVNTGSIHNPGGRIILGAGDMASLAFRNTGLIDAPGGEVNVVAGNGGLRNDGDIMADEILMQGAAIRHSGHIEAENVTLQTNANLSLRLGSALGAENVWLIADADANGFGFVNIDISLDLGGDLVASGTDVFFRGFTIDTGGSQEYVGDFWLGEDTVLTGTEIVFDGRVNSKAVRGRNDRHLTVNGDVSFLDTVGDSTFGLLRSLVVNGDAMIGGGLVRTTEQQLYEGAVTLGADALLRSEEAGLIRFSHTLDGRHDLLIETGGTTEFLGEVGRTSRLNSLETDAPGTTLIAADMKAITMTFGDAVELGARSVLRGRDSVDFQQKVTGNGHDLIVKSAATTFHGRVKDVGLLRTTGDGPTTVDTDRITAQKIDFRNDVWVTGDARVRGTNSVDFRQTLDGPGALEVLSDRLIHFGGDVGGDTPFESLTLESGGRDVVDENTIVIDGHLIRVEGDILLNPQGKRSPARVASVASTGDVTFESLFGDISMGVNEKVTSLGAMDLVARNGSITHGDLNAVVSISIDTPDARVYQRNPSLLFGSDGRLFVDLGTDVIAGESIDYSSTPSFVGPGPLAFFATRDGALIKGPDGVRLFRMDIERNMFVLNPILDLAILFGISNIGLETVYDSDLQFEDRVMLDPVALRGLQERLGLDLRVATAEELLATVTGRELYMDVAGTGLERDRPQISAHRLRKQSVLQVMAHHDKVFLRERTDPDTGELVREDQAEHVRQVLAWAWTDYAALGDQPPTAGGFRSYLEASPEHAEALDCLTGLQDLFRELRTMGTTPAEMRACVDRVLGDVRPADMDQSTLEQVVVSPQELG